MHFICYINRSIATRVNSTYLGYCPTAHNVLCLVATGGREPVTSISLSHVPYLIVHTLYEECRERISFVTKLKIITTLQIYSTRTKVCRDYMKY